MKVKEIRAMSQSEIARKLEDLKQGLFNLRFQHETGQLDNNSRLKQNRRDIARLNTILREIEMKQQKDTK